VIAAPLVAHGIGARGDLPLPVWLFAYGAGIAVVLTFATLRLLWRRPVLDGAAAGSPAPAWTGPALRWLAVAARAFGLAAFVLVLVAAAIGSEETTENLAPVAVYVLFWVGLQLLSPVLGDVWRVLSPWDTLALLAERVRGGRPAATATPSPEASCWPAVVGLAAFSWLELCYHDPASPRVLALAIAAYTVAMLAGAARHGRAWLRTGDGIGVWFALLAALSPLHVEGGGVHTDGGRRGAGSTPRRLVLRWPTSGLADLVMRPGTVAVILVVLGSTTFDGVTRTSFWSDVVGTRSGWALTAVSTIGLAWVVGLVALAYVAAMRAGAALTGRPAEALVGPFAHSLVPIALAYAVAHYFSLAVFEGQGALALLSDPLGRGWDLFGTAGWDIDYRAVSPSTIAWVQAGAIVVGHAVGVAVAHDRAVALFDRRQADRSQRPLVGVMVAYTVGGLALLLGA
jgi:hypothetical protein